jgi:hypothetical protein
MAPKKSALVLLACLLSTHSAAAQSGTPDPDTAKPAPLTFASHTFRLGVDFTFASVSDGSQQETLGRERQIKVAYANLSFGTDVGEHFSFFVMINPANDEAVPNPYIPSASDRRTFFFPNQPEGRGVASNPNGIKNVDDYKYSQFDPIIQQGVLRLGYLDIHTTDRKMGIVLGRNYVPQGLSLDELVWFTAKDLTHIQRINAQADNGFTLYYNTPQLRVDIAGITGNANPYHDYGYFDFTDASEDKNSALGAVATGRYTIPNWKTSIGGTYRKNFLNSRIEDSISLQLSKHNDDAYLGFVTAQPIEYVRVFGEVARYKWGLADTSAALLPGPPNVNPVWKSGYYVGADVYSPQTPYGKWGVTFTREELSRDDSLVAFADANNLFGVKLGKKERSYILKVQAQFKELTAFAFVNDLSNPYPQLSALAPISGPGANEEVSDRKVGFGIRFRLSR